MQEYLFVFSGENPKIAFAELHEVSSFILKKFKAKNLGERTAAISVTSGADKKIMEIQSRLSYSKSAGKVLFLSSEKEILKKTEKYPWHRVYSKDFSVRNKSIEGKSRIQERELASGIWNELIQNGISAKVNLDNPKTKIEFIFSGKKVFSTMQIAGSRENFAEREPKRRPGFAPVSMSPKLCRAMVNLCSAGKKEQITDPFCGTGGIILEAAILGYKTEGFDIDSEMIMRAKENMLHFQVKNCKLKVMDASLLNKKMNYIACDMPYGLRSMISEKKEQLYPKFFSVLKRFLGKRAVIGIQKSAETEKILKALPRGLRITGRFSQYIHKSLTKEIIVIDKR